MANNCLTCHVAPDFRLKESRPDAYRDYPDKVRIIEGKGYFFLDEITNHVSNQVRDYFEYLRLQKIKHAIIDIHSPGGSLMASWRVKGLINEFQNDGGIVETRLRGLAASGGAIIFVAGSKEYRIANAQSELMLHELLSFKFIDIATPSDKEDEARVLRHLQDTISSWLATRGKLTKAELDERMRKKEFWLNGKEAFEIGFVDKLIFDR